MKASTKKPESDELYELGKIKWSISSLLTPKSFGILLSPLLVALLGASSRGDVFFYFVLTWINWDKLRFLNRETADDNSTAAQNGVLRNNTQTTSSDSDVIRSDLDAFLHRYKLDDVYYIVPSAIAVSYVVFFGLGGYLQWFYYIQRRHEPETWKCQPKKFLSKKDERHEILLGATNLLIGASISGVLATLVINGADVSTLYFNVSDYGWIYLFVSTAICFLFQDAAAYYIHRALHWPFFYKRFHKLHHRYHSPTAFSAVAMHPYEFLALQGALAVPMFTVPIHFVAFLFCVFYTYYYGMIDHSGIDFDAIWPWQPPVRFHDDHHKYFHVNFGFNTLLFDRYHDTLRKKSRVYSEDIFGGKGAKKVENILKKMD